MRLSPQVRALLAVVVGCLLLAVAVVYFIEPAGSLPGFFPGHAGAGSSEHAHHHVKHGIAALAVGLVVLAYAWFATGPASRRRA